jgi:hypothetical protein
MQGHRIRLPSRAVFATRLRIKRANPARNLKGELDVRVKADKVMISAIAPASLAAVALANKTANRLEADDQR